MSDASANQQKLQAIRRRLLSGQITYDQAKLEAQPIIDGVNAKGRLLTKKYKLSYRPISFAALMR